jgi:hypothetical protein
MQLIIAIIKSLVIPLPDLTKPKSLLIATIIKIGVKLIFQ